MLSLSVSLLPWALILPSAVAEHCSLAVVEDALPTAAVHVLALDVSFQVHPRMVGLQSVLEVGCPPVHDAVATALVIGSHHTLLQ